MRDHAKSEFFGALERATDSGLTVPASLDLIITPPARRRIAGKLRQRLDAGATVAEAFRAEPAFSLFDAAMLDAAEKGGRMADGFRLLAERYRGRSRAWYSTLLAMIYPAYLLGGMLLVVAILAVASEHIPAAWENLLWMLPLTFTLVLIIVLAALPFFWFPRGSRTGLQRFFLALPWPWHSWLRYSTLHPFLINLRYLYQAGVPVNGALAITAAATEIELLKSDLAPVAQQLGSGASFERCLVLSSLLPDDIRQAIILGEKTGSLEKTLLQVESEYGFRLDKLSKQIPLALALGATGLIMTAAVFAVIKLFSVYLGTMTQMLPP